MFLTASILRVVMFWLLFKLGALAVAVWTWKPINLRSRFPFRSVLRKLKLSESNSSNCKKTIINPTFDRRNNFNPSLAVCLRVQPTSPRSFIVNDFPFPHAGKPFSHAKFDCLLIEFTHKFTSLHLTHTHARQFYFNISLEYWICFRFWLILHGTMTVSEHS